MGNFFVVMFLVGLLLYVFVDWATFAVQVRKLKVNYDYLWKGSWHTSRRFKIVKPKYLVPRKIYSCKRPRGLGNVYSLTNADGLIYTIHDYISAVLEGFATIFTKLSRLDIRDSGVFTESSNGNNWEMI